MEHLLGDDSIPMGLGMALAQNLPAMNRFAAMTGDEQQAFLRKARAMRSAEDMRRYVQSLLT